MLAEGLLARRHVRPRRRSLEVLARPRTHRVLWFTVWSAAAGDGRSRAARAAGGVRAAPAGASRPRGCVRALLLVPFVLPTVVVGVAFRQLLGEAGPLGFLGLDGTPVAIVAGLAFFNVAVVIRAVGARLGVPRPAAGRGRRGARRQPGARCSAPSRCPRCGRRSCRRRAWCSCSARPRSASCSPSAALRYATVETEIYLLTTQLLDLQAAAALSIAAAGRGDRCCWSLVGAAARRARPGRRAAVAAPAAAPARRTPPQLVAHRRCCSCSWPRPSLTLVVGSLRVDDALEPGQLPRARPPRRPARRCWCR